MNANTQRAELERLAVIASRWRGARDVQYAVGFGGEHLVAGADVVLEFCEAATVDERQFYFHAYPDVRFLLRLAGRLLNKRDAQTPGPSKRSKGGGLAADCAIKCQLEAFRAFLRERHALAENASDDEVATCVRDRLNIKSRKELNSNPEAARAWIDLRADFTVWSSM